MKALSKFTFATCILVSGEPYAFPYEAQAQATANEKSSQCIFHKVIGTASADNAGDVVVAGVFNSTQQSKGITVVELDNLKGNYSSADISVVPTLKLMAKTSQWSLEKPAVINAPYDDLFVSAIVDNRYLLEGSDVSYELCLKSVNEGEQKSATLFVANYWGVNNCRSSAAECKQQYSDAHLELVTNKNGDEVCETLTFKVTRPDLYFLFSHTPKNSEYSVNYKETKRYYDPDDFRQYSTPACDVMKDSDCSYPPSEFASDTVYSVLGEIKSVPFESTAYFSFCVEGGAQWTKPNDEETIKKQSDPNEL